MPTVVACPACRTRLLARRGDALCASCVKAARELASQPLWLFDSPLLRRALAEVNLPAVPAIVRAACGLSQRDLAAMVGWSGAALSYYERGRRDGMFDIRMVQLFADAVGMPRAALLPLVFADPDASLAGDSGNGTSAGPDRRGCGGGTVAGIAAVPSSVSVPRVVSGSHVRYWRACTDVLYARGRAVGGTTLLAPALQQWRRVRLVLREGGAAEISAQLLAAAGEMALCTGRIALDAGHPQLAQYLHTEARKLADSTADSVLVVHALADESMLFAEMADAGPGRDPARQALRLAFQAQEEGRYLPMPRLHALIALRHASAAALLGDKTAFQAAITRARRQLEHGAENDSPPEWLRFVDVTEITAAEAQGYLNLGETSRSVLLYRQALDTGLSPRSRASYGAGLAVALLKQGALGEAVGAAMDVLPALEAGVISIRCLGQLRLVRQAAGTTPGAQEFRERFDAIDRTPATSYDLPGGDAPQATARTPVSPHDTGTAAQVG